MTEEQKVARAKELKAEGLSLRKIGKAMGVSHATAAALLERGGPKCERCSDPLHESSTDPLCGFCRVEALEALYQEAPVRTLAGFQLREQGYTAEQVVQAIRQAKSGAPLEKVAAELGVPA